MRLFFCVELGPQVRRALAEAEDQLRVHLSGPAKWVDPANLHLTVRFVGEVGEELAPALQECGSGVAAGGQPFSLSLTRLGAFPRPDRARVVWAGADEDSPLFADLARRAEAAVQASGVPPERRQATAHVTLARLRRPQDVAGALAEVQLRPVTVEVTTLTLMESKLRPQGPIYTPVARWRLGG